MSKQYKIRWSEDDLKEVKRVVTNFNRKVDRLLKKNPSQKNMLPEKVVVAQFIDLIGTRQDLNRELNTLKRFSKRGAEELVDVPDTDYNLKITKWQRTEINRRVAIINQRRKRRLEEIQDLEMSSRGEPLGYTRGQFGMGTIEENELKPIKGFTRRMAQYDIKWKWKSIREESQSDYYTKKDEQLKANVIKGIKENYDYERVKDIIKHIEKMDMGVFLDIFNSEGASFEIISPDGYLDIKQDEYYAYEEALRSTWMRKNK